MKRLLVPVAGVEGTGGMSNRAKDFVGDITVVSATMLGSRRELLLLSDIALGSVGVPCLRGGFGLLSFALTLRAVDAHEETLRDLARPEVLGLRAGLRDLRRLRSRESLDDRRLLSRSRDSLLLRPRWRGGVLLRLRSRWLRELRYLCLSSERGRELYRSTEREGEVLREYGRFLRDLTDFRL